MGIKKYFEAIEGIDYNEWKKLKRYVDYAFSRMTDHAQKDMKLEIYSYSDKDDKQKESHGEVAL